MAWSFIASNLLPSSIILIISRNYIAHSLNYHFDLLTSEISEVFKEFAYLFCTQTVSKTSKMALDSHHQSAVSLLSCIASWVIVTQIVGHIEKVQLSPESSFSGLKSLVQNVFY